MITSMDVDDPGAITGVRRYKIFAQASKSDTKSCYRKLPKLLPKAFKANSEIKQLHISLSCPFTQNPVPGI